MYVSKLWKVKKALVLIEAEVLFEVLWYLMSPNFLRA